jgi:hypothetical protein
MEFAWAKVGGVKFNNTPYVHPTGGAFFLLNIKNNCVNN